MHHGVETPQVCEREISEILVEFRNRRRLVSKVAACEEINVEAGHFMANPEQNGPSHCADVTFMTGEQNFHVTPVLEDVGACDLDEMERESQKHLIALFSGPGRVLRILQIRRDLGSTNRRYEPHPSEYISCLVQ
jgi:hypothetical protein